LHEIRREGWKWADEQMIKFRWRSGSPSGYKDCFPDSSLLGDTESGYQPTALRDAAVHGMQCMHRHSNYNVITSLALSGVMHCPKTSSIVLCIMLRRLIANSFARRKNFITRPQRLWQLYQCEQLIICLPSDFPKKSSQHKHI